VIEAARRQRHAESTEAERRLRAWKKMIALCLLTRREHRIGDGSRSDGNGGSLPIDPGVPIEDVVLSSRMQRWHLFRDLLERLRFERPVRESSLMTLPL